MTKRNQFFVLLAVPLVAALFSFEVRADFLTSTFLFLGIPSLLLSWWSPGHVRKAALFALTFIPLWIFLDLVIYINQQWYVVSAYSYRLFGLIAWEEIAAIFLLQYSVVMFWEHFFERKRRERPWRRRMTYLAAVFIGIFLLGMLLWRWNPSILHIPYFYFMMMAVFFGIPAVLEVIRHPNLGAKFFRTSLYFAYAFLAYDLTGIALGQWTFPGQYMAWISIAGVSLPLDDFISWILIGTAACLAWYEHFDDDEK